MKADIQFFNLLTNKALNSEELRRKREQFIQWSDQFTETLLKLHLIGFKGYLIKNDGTFETLLHEWAEKEIKNIHEYIEAKQKEIFGEALNFKSD